MEDFKIIEEAIDIAIKNTSLFNRLDVVRLNQALENIKEEIS